MFIHILEVSSFSTSYSVSAIVRNTYCTTRANAANPPITKTLLNAPYAPPTPPTPCSYSFRFNWFLWRAVRKIELMVNNTNNNSNLNFKSIHLQSYIIKQNIPKGSSKSRSSLFPPLEFPELIEESPANLAWRARIRS